MTSAKRSKLKTLLNLVHGVRAFLQLFSLTFIQCLFDDAYDAMGTKHAGKTEKYFFFNSVKTLRNKIPNIWEKFLASPCFQCTNQAVSFIFSQFVERKAKIKAQVKYDGTKSGGGTLHFVVHLSLSVQTRSCFPLALVFFASRSTNKLKGAARIMLPTLLTFQ